MAGARVGGHPHAAGRRRLEDAERLLCGREVRPPSSADQARASSCSAVPCESGLVTGGAPPSKRNRYSQAMPRAAGSPAGGLLRAAGADWRFRAPTGNSRWPLRRCRATGSRGPGRGGAPPILLPGKLTRSPLESSGSVVHQRRLRSSVRNTDACREPLSAPAAAICWTFASTAPSSAARVPLSLPRERLAAT